MASLETVLENQKTPDMVFIPRRVYENLVERSNWLRFLEIAGVDNWEGYSFAIDLRDGEEKEEEEDEEEKQ